MYTGPDFLPPREVGPTHGRNAFTGTTSPRSKSPALGSRRLHKGRLRDGSGEGHHSVQAPFSPPQVPLSALTRDHIPVTRVTRSTQTFADPPPGGKAGYERPGTRRDFFNIELPQPSSSDCRYPAPFGPPALREHADYRPPVPRSHPGDLAKSPFFKGIYRRLLFGDVWTAKTAQQARRGARNIFPGGHTTSRSFVLRSFENFSLVNSDEPSPKHQSPECPDSGSSLECPDSGRDTFFIKLPQPFVFGLPFRAPFGPNALREHPVSLAKLAETSWRERILRLQSSF